MNKKSELLCAYSGFFFVVMLSAGMWFMTNWFSPMDPGLTPSQVQQMFVANTNHIRIGATIMAFSGVFFWPLSAAITTQMKRIEGGTHPLATVQLATSSGTVITILLVAFLWLTVAFRPESYAPQTMQMVNDFCWISFVALYPPGFLECLVIGICIMADPAQRVYPRWLGPANILTAIIFVLGAAVPFFTSGPFAWNGVISYWLVAAVFFGWLLVMSWATIRAIQTAAVTVPAAPWSAARAAE